MTALTENGLLAKSKSALVPWLVFAGLVLTLWNTVLLSSAFGYSGNVSLDSGYRKYSSYDAKDQYGYDSEGIGEWENVCGRSWFEAWFAEVKWRNDLQSMWTYDNAGGQICYENIYNSDRRLYSPWPACRFCEVTRNYPASGCFPNYDRSNLRLEAGNMVSKWCGPCTGSCAAPYQSGNACGAQPPAEVSVTRKESGESAYTFTLDRCERGKKAKSLRVKTGGGGSHAGVSIHTSMAQPPGEGFLINGQAPIEIRQKYFAPGSNQCPVTYYWSGDLSWDIPLTNKKCGDQVTITPSLETGYGAAEIAVLEVVYEECDLTINSFTRNREQIDPSIGESVIFSGEMTGSATRSVSWTVTIQDGSGASLRTFQGSGLNVSASWDGKDSFGRIVDDGNYTAALEARTEDGECLQTAAAQVVVKSSCGDIMLSANPPEVWPASTGEESRTKADIAIRLSRPAPSRGCEVNLRIEPVDGTGGHSHDGNRRAHTGGVNPNFALFVEGETELHVEYTGGEVAGTEKIVAELLDENGNVQSTRNISIDVKVPDLRPLGGSEYYVLTGDRPAHPSNHYGQFWTNWAIDDVAFDYWHATETILGINDISLIWGGLFDVGINWSSSPGHISHRTGESVDIDRCASGVLVKQLMLDRIVRSNGGVRIIEDALRPPPCQGPADTARIHYGFQ